MAYYSPLLSELKWCSVNYSDLTVWRVVDEKMAFSDTLAIRYFPRLREVVDSLDDPITVELEAGRDEQNHRYIAGRLKFGADLACQRCLEPFHQSFDLPFSWRLAESEYEADLMGDDESILVLEEGYPTELVHHLEDEMLLALPVIPYHADDEPCAGREYMKNQKKSELIEEDKEEKENPFAVLSDLLDN